MRKRTLPLLAALALAPVMSHADPPSAAPPLPAVVQKYVQAVQNLKAVTVDATQTEPATPTDSGHLVLQAPNKMRLLSTTDGKPTATLVCDGHTVTQWDEQHVNTQTAPATWDKINTVLGFGAAAAYAQAFLTDPTTVTDYANLKDMGTDALPDGRTAERVVSVEDGDTATFWLSLKTALPLQAAFTGGRRDRTIVFHYAPADLPAVPDVFTPAVPAGRTAYAPPADSPLLAVGTRAPDFTLHRAGPGGVRPETLSLSGLKGQVVLMDFWASWCRPCKKTMPHIQALRDRMAGQGITFLSVNTWDQTPRMAAFLKAHPQYTTTMLCDPSPADQSVAVLKYHVSGIPTVYIIDRTGRVAGAFIGDDPDAAKSIEDTLTKLGV